ncbi:MAG TPA: MFS transporter [Candidatus Pacearchaeota archaeon]|nr:MFS transporter [Candidatus Pacearchaeota archaeon]HPR80058.1 MFS transporter [Candidatus Pacearchaeota archaeon]
MNIFPKIEKVAKNVTFVHLPLMFSYKLFSLYFPLYLLEKNFSLVQVGYTNFLIYLPIALFSPIAGYLNHKINPAILASLGVLGYGLYSLGMIFFPNLFVFYLLQIILGISAALFFVSSRAIMMGSNLKNPDKAFAFFYSVPSYADALAPAIGALLIWKFGFIGVFAASVVFQILTSMYCFFSLRKDSEKLTEDIEVHESVKNYSKIFKTMKLKGTLPLIITSFLVLIISGFNNTFFVLFLKNINWSQNQILIFSSLISIVYLPLSYLVIKIIKKKSVSNISYGSQIVGIFSIILGASVSFLNFYLAFIIMLGKNVGGLIANSGRSGLLTTKLKKYPEESAAIDTIFSPLSTAFGALIGGLIIGPLGYPLIFATSGVLIFTCGLLSKKSSIS